MGLRRRLCTLLLLLLACLDAWALEGPRVKTPLGAVRGYYKVSKDGRQYEAYEGVPYALPPIGKLRFKAPKKIPAWPGELQATRFGAECLQYTQLPHDPKEYVVGSEDCLYLNIYVPVRDNSQGNSPMPVLLWIHGGAFQFGSGNEMGAKYLMDRDIVFVTINYRLGPLGFLSTDDEIVPGNMGLKDQSMAIRFVSENIEWFGGDPKKLTLVGLSAGGASVHYHYLSPLSAGLFHAGISMSGTTLDCWTQERNGLEKAKKLGALMGCPTTTTKEMVQCLRYRPGKTLVQAMADYQIFYYNPFTPFGPVAEKTSNGAFIDRTPAEIIASGTPSDVPWVTGVTSEEGLWPVAEFMLIEESMKQLDENWELIAPPFLFFNYTAPKERQVELSQLIRKHYLGDKPIDKSTTKELVQLAGDRFFVVDAEKAARLQAKANKQPVWFYYFSYRGTQSLSSSMCGSTENYGVSHADDAYMIVDTPYMDPTTDSKDLEVQQYLIDFWVSVATNGVPKVNNVEWPPLNPAQKELQFLHIAGPGKVYMDKNANLGEKQFWESLQLRENVLPSTTGTVKEEL